MGEFERGCRGYEEGDDCCNSDKERDAIGHCY